LLSALLVPGGSAAAQDNIRGGVEPIIGSIDPSKLTYNILVDRSYEYYIGKPVHSKDPKGTGPFILASLEMGQLKQPVVK
jgi:hypothetical protein